MRWGGRSFGHRPLLFTLMHVTTDPAELASRSCDYCVLVSAGLVLRSGLVYGISIAAGLVRCLACAG